VKLIQLNVGVLFNAENVDPAAVTQLATGAMLSAGMEIPAIAKELRKGIPHLLALLVNELIRPVLQALDEEIRVKVSDGESAAPSGEADADEAEATDTDADADAAELTDADKAEIRAIMKALDEAEAAATAPPSEEAAQATPRARRMLVLGMI
jgi:hypothetical protein